MPLDPLLDPRNHALARTLKRFGIQNALRLVVEAKRAGLPVSLAVAIAERETTTGANVWGGDPPPNGHTSSLHGKPVTKAAYLAYRGARGPSGRGGMQGVGPLQLTWWEFQDEADRLGGCWKPACNLRLGFTHLAAAIMARGLHGGVAAYNGAGPAADEYAHDVLKNKMPKWHRRLA